MIGGFHLPERSGRSPLGKGHLNQVYGTGEQELTEENWREELFHLQQKPEDGACPVHRTEKQPVDLG